MVKPPDLFGCGSLLRSEDVGRTLFTIEWISHIASHHKTALRVQMPVVLQGLQHALSCITCGTAPYSHYDGVASSVDGIGYHLSDTIGGGVHGVTFVFGHERKSACRSHFHKGSLAIVRHGIRTSDLLHQGTMNTQGHVNGGQQTLDTLHQSLAPIA